MDELGEAVVEWLAVSTVSTERDTVQIQVEALRRKLLDLSLRNRMLNYRPSKRLGITVLGEDSFLVHRLLVEDGKKMVFTGRPDPPKSAGKSQSALYGQDDAVRMAKYREAAEEELNAFLDNAALPVDQLDNKFNTEEFESDLQAKLRTIAREAQLANDELGINTLFITLGALEWSETPDRSYRAPLVFVPVRLEKQANGSMRLLHDGSDIGSNLPLRAKLAEFNLTLPDLDEDKSILDYFSEIESTIEGRSNWHVHANEICLGFFNYEKYAMYVDLGGDSWPPERKPWMHPDLLAMLGSGYSSPESPISGDTLLDDVRPVPACHEVFDADSSQTLAMIRAADGLSIVVEGPPGTGKSQTITNIIAEAVAAGKTVLFVSAKRAALEVVRRNMERADLGAMCLDLHDKLTNRREFYSEIKRTVSRSISIKDEEEKVARLTELRGKLNAHSAAVNEPLAEFGVTPFAAMAILGKLPPETPEDREGRIPFEALRSRRESDIRAGLPAVRSLQQHLRTIGVPVEHPFWGCEIDYVDPARKLDLEQDLAAAIPLAEQAIARFQEAADRLRIDVEPSTENVRTLRICTELALNAPPHDGVAMETATWKTEESSARNVIGELKMRQAIRAKHSASVNSEIWNADLASIGYAYDTHAAKWFKFLIGAYRQARTALDPYVVGVAEPLRRAELVRDVRRAQQADAAIGAASDGMRRLFGVQWRGVDTDPAVLERLLDWVLALHDRVAGGQVPAGLLDFFSGVHSDGDLIPPVEAADRASATAAQAFDQVAALLATTGSKINPPLVAPNPVPERRVESLHGRDARATSEREGGLEGSLHGRDTRATAEQEAGPQESLHGRDARATAEQEEGPQESLHGRDARATAEREGGPQESLHGRDARATSEQEAGPQESLHGRDARATSEREEGPQESLRGRDARATAEREGGLEGSLHGWDARATAEQEGGSDVSWPSLLHRLRNWQQNLAKLPAYIAFNESRRQALEKNLGPVVEIADRWPSAAEKLADTYLRSYYGGVVREAMQTRPELRTFERVGHEAAIDEFQSLDDFKLRYNRAQVRLAHQKRLPTFENALGNLHLLKLQCELQRKHKPIRWIMARAGEAIQRIKPVFMMSPLSVAIHLPPELPPFDMVIFDEASQIKPEDALSAIIRAKQAIVVGDTKQMPPTSFFDRLNDDDDEAEDGSEEAELGNEARKLESILSLMSGVTMGRVRRPDLRWHYRSIHPSLIQPSNEMFYENRLVVFPSPSEMQEGRRIGVVFHHHPETVYEPGSKNRVNREEAKMVADRVLEHIQTRPDESLLVAAMNKPQADLIYDEVQKRERVQPDAFEAYRTKNPFEPLAVKNLENVQGDERDVVFISVTYGRDAAGVLRQQFGPLLQDGGERRLNVLITRARKRCEVFSNIAADDIRLENPKAGVQSLKRYLQFAATGVIDIAVPTGMQEESPFEEEVADVLRDHGFEIHPQVGSEGYRIDLGVLDPKQPGRYLLGIECDGATYHRARSARDRDKLRQRVLEHRGWRLHRIWSHDWWQDREGEVRRLLEAIRAAPEEAPPDPPEAIVEVIVQETERATPEAAGVRPYRQAAAPVGLATDADVERYLLDVIRVEGPICRELLMSRLKEATGYTRAGSNVRAWLNSHLDRATAKAKQAADGYFLNEEQLRQPRDWSGRPTAERKVEFVPEVELAAALREVVRSAFGISEEAAAKAAFNLLGFKRVTEKAEERARVVLTKMISAGGVKRREDGQLVI